MSHKKDVIMRIRDEERMKRMSIALAKRLEKMTPQEREEFVDKLIKKARIINAELEDLQEQDIKLENRHLKGDVSDKAIFTILGISVLVFGLSSGLISACLLPPELILLAPPAVIVGAIGGVGLTCLGSIMAKNKVISNFFAKIKQTLIDVKQNKLNKDKNKIQLQLDKAEEFIK